jgi:hypothetical protein
MSICRNCGSTESQARADARTLGFQQEFDNGVYTCCQVVAWADEQWHAWMEAASEDGKNTEQAARMLEISVDSGSKPPEDGESTDR